MQLEIQTRTNDANNAFIKSHQKNIEGFHSDCERSETMEKQVAHVIIASSCNKLAKRNVHSVPPTEKTDSKSIDKVENQMYRIHHEDSGNCVK